jgi:hypothetical protein
MTLKYYRRAGRKFVKSMILLIEKRVPVLDYDGLIITHTSVINEHLEDVFFEVSLWPRLRYGSHFLIS